MKLILNVYLAQYIQNVILTCNQTVMKITDESLCTAFEIQTMVYISIYTSNISKA